MIKKQNNIRRYLAIKTFINRKKYVSSIIINNIVRRRLVKEDYTHKILAINL